MAFFADVLGSQGKGAFVFAARDEGTPLVHKWVDLSDPAAFRAALLQADDINLAGADVYFTPASYGGRIVRHVAKGERGKLGRTRGRLRDNVQAIQSFWVDIDAGPAKWEAAGEAKRAGLYRTKAKALDGVQAALEAVGTLSDPTYIVDSGAGIHLYWCMEWGIPVDLWTRIAERLRDTLLTAGLRLDRARSRDAASIMRLPGSIHWGESDRLDDEIRGRLLGKLSEPMDPEAFVAQLKASHVVPAGAPPRTAKQSPSMMIGGIAVPQGALTRSLERAAKTEKLPPPKDTDYNIKLVWNMLISRGSDLAYEEWRDVIWAVKDTGWDCAYELLERWCALSDTQWAKPWESELRKVWESDNGTSTRRITCASLIAWAREESGDDALRFLDERESRIESEGGQVIAVKHPGKGEQTYVLPKLPKGFMRKEGEPGIWARIASVDEGGADFNEAETEFEWFKFVDIDVFLADRVTEDKGEHSLSVVKIEPCAGMEVFNLPASITSSIAKTAEALSARSIFINGAHGWKLMTRYLIEQGKTLIQNKKATDRLTALGWHGVEDDRTFVVGNTAWDIYGDKHPVQFSPRVAELAKSTKPRGTLELWKKLPALYEGPEYAPAQAMILMSMGAPLHALTGEIGGVVNLYSEGSGYGKSSVLKTALSVWSGVADNTNAETLLIGDKTDMGGEFKLTQANSLPVGLDEITGSITSGGVDRKRSQAALRQFIYNSTQGRGKTRLKSSADGLRESGSWDTFLLATANAPIETIFASDANRSGDAERARTLDLDGNTMPFISNFESAGIARTELARRKQILTNVLPNNYGVAGEALLEAYFADFDTIKARIEELMVDYTYRHSTRERFIVAKLAIARAAWEVATRIGLVDYQWPPIEACIVDAIVAQHAARKESTSSDPDTLLNEYIRLHASQFAMVKHINGKPVPYGSRPPRDPLVGRWEVDYNRLYLLRAELRAFCADNRVNLNTLDEYLKRTRCVLHKGIKVSLGKGHGISGQQYAIAIDPIKAGIVAPPDDENDNEGEIYG